MLAVLLLLSPFSILYCLFLSYVLNGFFFFFFFFLTFFGFDLYPVPRKHIDVFFSNIISLPERRNKRKSVLEITKMYYF